MKKLLRRSCVLLLGLWLGCAESEPPAAASLGDVAGAALGVATVGTVAGPVPLEEIQTELPGCAVEPDAASRTAWTLADVGGSRLAAAADCSYACRPVWARCDSCTGGKLRLVDRWYCKSPTGCPDAYYTRTGPCLYAC